LADKQTEKVGNCEVAPRVLWPIVKSLMKRDGTKASSAVHAILRIIYNPKKKANLVADFSEIHFTSHDLCAENRERQVETESKLCSRL
jgi:hypothetical protein